jgi:hypothetical protein
VANLTPGWKVCQSLMVDWAAGVTVRNGVLGIHFVYSDKRQWSGDAYATLQTDKDMELALAHDQAQMNHRYLESRFFRSLELPSV